MFPKLIRTILLLFAVILAITACGEATPAPTATLETTPTSEMPTSTPIPMAFTVNGEGFTAAEFDAEMERYTADQVALGRTPTAEEATQVVLDDLIAQVLLAQGAQEAGYVVDDGTLQSRINALVTKLGSSDALTQWQTEHGYTDETFRVSLKRAIAVAWMRDLVASQVPDAIEQVHAQQILVFKEETAQGILNQLESGADFDTLAAAYDPITRGDLGWFPRGYLLESVVEDAAFALQPGQISGVIASGVGFHIIYVIDRETSRLLAPEPLLALQKEAVTAWVKTQREQSAIVLAP